MAQEDVSTQAKRTGNRDAAVCARVSAHTLYNSWPQRPRDDEDDGPGRASFCTGVFGACSREAGKPGIEVRVEAARRTGRPGTARGNEQTISFQGRPCSQDLPPGSRCSSSISDRKVRLQGRRDARDRVLVLKLRGWKGNRSSEEE